MQFLLWQVAAPPIKHLCSLTGKARGVTFFVWTKKVTKENRRPCSLPWRTRAAAPIPGRGVWRIFISVYWEMIRVYECQPPPLRGRLQQEEQFFFKDISLAGIRGLGEEICQGGFAAREVLLCIWESKSKSWALAL